jgi:LuxR family maltose regulon positive regulatory protein
VPLDDQRHWYRYHLWVEQDRLAEALSWAREQGLSTDDDLSYLREFEYITLARVLIAQYRNEPEENVIAGAMGLLDRLWQAAEEGGRQGSVIEILVQQALAHEAQDTLSAALVPLKQALTLAEPEGYVRIFVDEGQPLVRLLSVAAAEGLRQNYTAKLLAAFEDRTDDGRFSFVADRAIEPTRVRNTGTPGPGTLQS